MNLFDDAGRDRFGDLAAVWAVDFIAVVFRGIMRSRVVGRGDDDTGSGLQVAHREGQHRNRTQAVVNIGVDAVSREDLSGNLCEFLREVSGIVGDRDALFRVSWIFFQEILR